MIGLHTIWHYYEHTTHIPALFDYIHDVHYIYIRVIMIGPHIFLYYYDMQQ